MNFQKLKGGMIAGFAMTGLVASLGLGSGVAAVADMGDDETPQPGSTVQTAENCVWYMTGAPTSLALKPADENAIYDGSELAISTGTTLSEISIYSSGNEGSQAEPTACTFYAGKKAPRLTWQINTSAPKFIATDESDTVDENFNFDFDLTFELDQKNKGQSRQTCESAFAVTDVELNASSKSVVGIQIEDVDDVTLPIEGRNQFCSTSVKAETTIPENSVAPASAGERYTWTGPTVTITGSTHQDSPS